MSIPAIRNLLAQVKAEHGKFQQTQCHIALVTRAIELMSEMLNRPNRWPTTRLIWSFGFLTLYMRRQFKPHYRWMKRDRSLLVFGCLGVVAMLTTPPWLVSWGDAIESFVRRQIAKKT